MKNILLVMTGGTIGALGDAENKNRNVDGSRANRLIIENFRNSDSFCREDVQFHVEQVLETLSENITLDAWNVLLDFLRERDFREYDGVIVCHGTDTLAYTASLLALVLGDAGVPVFVVSSELPLNVEGANGNVNFRAAVELTALGICPGVYVPYCNPDGTTYLHEASCIRQCELYTNEFRSLRYRKLEWPLKASWVQRFCQEREIWAAGIEGRKERICLPRMLKPCVLKLEPYVGMDYSHVNLDGVSAVVHGTYHALTACVSEPDRRDSVLWFWERCRERGIVVLASPSHSRVGDYLSGTIMVEAGITGVYGMTPEMTYVKALLAFSAFEEPAEAIAWIRRDFRGEFAGRKGRYSRGT